MTRHTGAAWLVILSALSSSFCGSGGDNRIRPVYDKNTGRLQRLDYDADKNGTVDTVSFMDGARVLRIEIDSNEDGKVDRWEHYDAAQRLDKVGFSRANDGIEDAWSYAAADGSIARIDMSTARDGKVTRTEYYEKDAIVRAEEDGDSDGAIDKWETFDATGRMTSVAFDTMHDGAPDRRLVYGPGGTANLEILK